MHYPTRFLRLHAVALCAFALALPAAAENHELDSSGLPNFMKVNEHVFRGAQPTDAGFQALAKMGVKTILNLREAEYSDAEERAVKAAGMKYVSVPMRGMSAPTSEQMIKVLALLNDESAGPVFVHCRRGADRTGTVIACYRIGHDQWENKKALSEAKQMGMSMWERAMQHYVTGYKAPVIDAAAKPAVTATPAAAAASNLP
jgi:protein tyrosine/serine phosphatase